MNPFSSVRLPEQFDGHIVLVGLPGSGKSTVGRAVAKRLRRPFLDFDSEITRRDGRSIARIFGESGEPQFREMEIALTRELAAAPPMVLAPGGGWITIPGALELLRPPARVVHLRVSPAAAIRRLARARIARPMLLVDDPLQKMTLIWESRAGLYGRADLEVNVELVDSQQVINTVVALARDLTREVG